MKRFSFTVTLPLSCLMRDTWYLFPPALGSETTPSSTLWSLQGRHLLVTLAKSLSLVLCWLKEQCTRLPLLPPAVALYSWTLPPANFWTLPWLLAPVQRASRETCLMHYSAFGVADWTLLSRAWQQPPLSHSVKSLFHYTLIALYSHCNSVAETIIFSKLLNYFLPMTILSNEIAQFSPTIFQFLKPLLSWWWLKQLTLFLDLWKWYRNAVFHALYS